MIKARLTRRVIVLCESKKSNTHASDAKFTWVYALGFSSGQGASRNYEIVLFHYFETSSSNKWKLGTHSFVTAPTTIGPFSRFS